MRPRRRLTTRLTAAASATVAFALVVLTIGFNLFVEGQLRKDADSVLSSRAQAQVATLSLGDNGRLGIAESPHDTALDERVWVFDAAGHVIERPPASPELQRFIDRLSRSSHRIRRDGPRDVRLLAQPVRLSGRRVGTVVAAVSLSPYEQTAHAAFVASLVLGALLLAALVALAWFVVHRALRPVAKMTAQAADWSEHDLDRRFGLGPPRDELTALAATLDDLLSRLGASIRHEQQLSAELSHELRTPLARMRSEAELALRSGRNDEERRAALQAILEQTERMTELVEALLAAARGEHGMDAGISDATDVAVAAIEQVRLDAREHGVELALEPLPEPIGVAADRDLAVRVLCPLLDNAVRHADGRVRLDVRRDDGAVVFTVTDDGPGVVPEEAERIFEPGVRGSAASEGGAGLGLPLARRLARAASGDVFAEADAATGRFSVRLPAR